MGKTDGDERSGAGMHETGEGQEVSLKQGTRVSSFKIKQEARDKKNE